MTDWMVDYNTKYPSFLSLRSPYNISFTSNKTGFPLKDCGNDDGGVPNVGNLYSAFILYNDRGRASVALSKSIPSQSIQPELAI